MEQEPQKVAAFVWECLEYRQCKREAAEQLGLDGYQIYTFSSDYDEFVDEFGIEVRG
jgi:hypothetical protein